MKVPSPTTILALIALILSAAATAQAIENDSVNSKSIVDGTIVSSDLGSVFSKSIAKDTVTSSDIKNEQVKASDIGSGAIAGDEVADGSIDQEDLGYSLSPGEAHTTKTKGAPSIDGSKTIVRQSAPAGSYVVFADVELFNFDNGDDTLVSCDIRADGVILGPQTGFLELDEDGGGERSEVVETITRVYQHAARGGGDVEFTLRCLENGSSSDVWFYGGRLTALRIDHGSGSFFP